LEKVKKNINELTITALDQIHLHVDRQVAVVAVLGVSPDEDPHDAADEAGVWDG